MPSGAGTVCAGGGLVWRPSSTSSGFEVLLVHRPRYDDWSFPKGKLEPGETEAECAVREVEEETGFVCRSGRELIAVHYEDAQGRPKRVRYWDMRIVSGDFRANEEVDAVSWIDLGNAVERLSYDADVGVLASLVAHLAESHDG